MDQNLLTTIQSTQENLDPRFKALRAATGALKQAARLASAEQADALAMQKALTKLQQADELMDDDSLTTALAAFGGETQKALDALAFDFARDLREIFEARGQKLEGRPPRLVVNELVLEIDIGTRKAQWIYGKEPLTRPIPLSFNPILKAYDAQRKAILERQIDIPAFLLELHAAWDQLVAKRTQAPPGKRISIIEAFSQVTLNRQSNRFWNAPARSTFKDYERAHFVRDLVLVHADPQVEIDGKVQRLRLTGATKAQADSAARSLWLPSSALDGEYYASLTFES